MTTDIAFCGLDCAQCPAYHAAERLTMAERQAVADKWAVEFGGEFTAESIDCVGCTSTEGTLGSYCAVCEIRLCGLAKAVSTCAACGEYGCEKLVGFWANAPEARANLEALRLN